jgi:hypothetical protein
MGGLESLSFLAAITIFWLLNPSDPWGILIPVVYIFSIFQSLKFSNLIIYRKILKKEFDIMMKCLAKDVVYDRNYRVF